MIHKNKVYIEISFCFSCKLTLSLWDYESSKTAATSEILFDKELINLLSLHLILFDTLLLIDSIPPGMSRNQLPYRVLANYFWVTMPNIAVGLPDSSYSEYCITQQQTSR